jgi:hypothetical protein
MAISPRPDLVHKAILAGAMYGNIVWKDSALQLMLDDPNMKGFTGQGVKILVRGHIRAGNTVETRREQWNEYLEKDPNDPFWYCVVIPVPEFPKGLFVKMKLDDDTENDPWVKIVSVHQEF